MATALVVGAGIGGLAATLALRAAGWDVRVLERASSPRELGFALLLAPNAMRALRALGLADQVAAGGYIASATEMRRPNGKVLRRMDASGVYKLLGEPAVVALRPVLHGTLLKAVGHEALLLDHEVVGFSTGGDGVNVRLADGNSLSARVLIGADGAGSVVRRQVRSGEPPPRESNLFALRGVAHGVVDRLDGASGAQYFGRGIEAGLARASGDAVYWYMSIPADQVRQGPIEADHVADRFTAAFHEPFRAIVQCDSVVGHTPRRAVRSRAARPLGRGTGDAARRRGAPDAAARGAGGGAGARGRGGARQGAVARHGARGGLP